MAVPPLSKHLRAPSGQKSSFDLMRESPIYRNLSEDRKLFLNTVRDISNKILVPNTVNLHKGTVKFADVMPKFDEIGIRGVGIPQEYGGSDSGPSILEMVFTHQYTAYGSTAVPAFFDGNNLFARVLLLGGNETQMAQYLPQIAEGKIVGCYALSDTNCGSDVAKMDSMRYAFDNGSYILNGAKTFVTNAPFADYAVVFAKNKDDGRQYRNITAFVVPAAEKNGGNGFVPEKPMDKLCWRGSETSIINLQEVSLPPGNVVGGKEDGFKLAVTALSYGRLAVAAEALGLMERVLDEVVSFAAGRRGVGGKLSESSLYQYQIGQIVQAITVTRNMLYNTAFSAETLSPDSEVFSFAYDAGILKSFAGQGLEMVANMGVKMMGGAGILFESSAVPVINGDSKLYNIGEGAENVLLMSIGKGVLG